MWNKLKKQPKIFKKIQMNWRAAFVNMYMCKCQQINTWWWVFNLCMEALPLARNRKPKGSQPRNRAPTSHFCMFAVVLNASKVTTIASPITPPKPNFEKLVSYNYMWPRAGVNADKQILKVYMYCCCKIGNAGILYWFAQNTSPSTVRAKATHVYVAAFLKPLLTHIGPFTHINPLFAHVNAI